MSALDYFTHDTRPDIDYGRDYQPMSMRDGRAYDDATMSGDALDCYSFAIDSLE